MPAGGSGAKNCPLPRLVDIWRAVCRSDDPAECDWGGWPRNGERGELEKEELCDESCVEPNEMPEVSADELA